MKKHIFAVVLLLALCCGCLSACANNVEPTLHYPRWEKYEGYVYDVRLSTFGEENNTMMLNGENYTKDVILASNSDEIRPDAVTGTYTVVIKKEGDNTCVTTTQDLLIGYNKNTHEEDIDRLTKAGVDSVESPEEFGDNIVTFESHNLCSVTFNTNTQRPVQSSRVIHGYYLGSSVAELSEVAVTCDYENKVITDMTNGEERSITVADNAAWFIDQLQLVTFVRSMDKSTGMADNPTVVAYDPVSDTSATVAFTLASKSKTVIKTDDGERCALLDATVASIGTTALAVVYNVPDVKTTDRVSIGTADVAKYTTARIQYGYYSYELRTYSEDILNEIIAK